MHKLDVWEVVKPTPGMHAISSRMIHDRNRQIHVDGVARLDEARKYQARLLYQGYTQVPGVNYDLVHL